VLLLLSTFIQYKKFLYFQASRELGLGLDGTPEPARHKNTQGVCLNRRPVGPAKGMITHGT
jgi:hypothetical protein